MADEKRKTGRPTKYEPSHPERVRGLALLGLTNEQMQSAFGISSPVFQDWRKRYPEFDQALLSGRLEADARVADALFARAVGCSHEHTEVFVIGGRVVEHKVRKHYPPDVQAATKWLHNRRPDLWRAVREPEDTGDDDAPQPVQVVVQVVDGRIRAEPESATG